MANRLFWEVGREGAGDVEEPMGSLEGPDARRRSGNGQLALYGRPISSCGAWVVEVWEGLGGVWRSKRGQEGPSSMDGKKRSSS